MIKLSCKTETGLSVQLAKARLYLDEQTLLWLDQAVLSELLSCDVKPSVVNYRSRKSASRVVSWNLSWKIEFYSYQCHNFLTHFGQAAKFFTNRSSMCSSFSGGTWDLMLYYFLVCQPDFTQVCCASEIVTWISLMEKVVNTERNVTTW